MIPGSPAFDLFRGLAFFEGAEHLPQGLPISLETIRTWADQSRLIGNPTHVLTGERIAAISRVCSIEDKLLVAIALSGEPGSLAYREYPYLPVPSLIRRGEAVAIVFWRMTGTGVKFRFSLAQCVEEFCSESTAARVVPQFAELLGNLPYPIKTYPDGSPAIAVEGHVRATFRRDGRQFDVDLTHEPAA